VPHGILHVLNTILYENEFQNPQILMDTLEITKSCLTLEVDTAPGFFAGVKNCTDSVHKFSRAFLLCYESVQFLRPAKQMAPCS
jgi:hypothetical protein